jgi:hypothetical protein
MEWIFGLHITLLTGGAVSLAMDEVRQHVSRPAHAARAESAESTGALFSLAAVRQPVLQGNAPTRLSESMADDFRALITVVRRAMPRNGPVMTICDELERRLAVVASPVGP